MERLAIRACACPSVKLNPRRRAYERIIRMNIILATKDVGIDDEDG